MGKLKAIKNILLGRPTIYRVKFSCKPEIKFTENERCYLYDVTNMSVDAEKVATLGFAGKGYALTPTNKE